MSASQEEVELLKPFWSRVTSRSLICSLMVVSVVWCEVKCHLHLSVAFSSTLVILPAWRAARSTRAFKSRRRKKHREASGVTFPRRALVTALRHFIHVVYKKGPKRKCAVIEVILLWSHYTCCAAALTITTITYMLTHSVAPSSHSAVHVLDKLCVFGWIGAK